LAGFGDPIEKILLAEKAASKESIVSGYKAMKAEGKDDIGHWLLETGVITDVKLAEALAIQHGLEYIGDKILIGTPEATEIISMEFARNRSALPLKLEDDELQIVIADPNDLSLIDDLNFMCGGMVVKLIVGTEKSIQKGITKSYGGSGEDIDNLMEEDSTKSEILSIDEGSFSEAVANSDEGAVIQLVNAIIGNAVRLGASDIHIESLEHNMRVRYRIDGKCSVVDRPPRPLQGAIHGRIKLMAKMDIAEKRKPQDGPVKLKVDGRNIDLRVSTLPTSFGESIVMRILDKEAVMKGVEQLGFHPTDYEVFKDLIERPNGIILVTGPTGSGKTTTLYAALNAKNKPNVKIITAEDPVEYNVSGINQIQVNHQIGLDFSRILRAMLRQAPNVVLVGEIRDKETAEIAIEASLTGHLVLSTLHTNDAPSSVTRLVDMGIKSYLISAAVIAILAQRLIRKNCKECIVEYTPPPEQLTAAGISAEMAEGRTFYKGKGCPVCNHSGYKGRVGIYELLKLNSELRQAIFKNEPTYVLREMAVRGGMNTLLMDGVRKVFAGMTTVEEILRVAKSSD